MSSLLWASSASEMTLKVWRYGSMEVSSKICH